MKTHTKKLILKSFKNFLILSGVVFNKLLEKLENFHEIFLQVLYVHFVEKKFAIIHKCFLQICKKKKKFLSQNFLSIYIYKALRYSCPALAQSFPENSIKFDAR